MMENTIIYITKDGLEKLKKEREELLLERPKVVQMVQTTRELGDLSENAGYQAAREDLTMIDSRLIELDELIKSAKVTEKSTKELVDVGTKVKIKDSTGSIFTYEIVGVSEADPKNSKISYESPIGKALFKKKVGEKAVVQTPVGENTFEIINLE